MALEDEIIKALEYGLDCQTQIRVLIEKHKQLQDKYISLAEEHLALKKKYELLKKDNK